MELRRYFTLLLRGWWIILVATAVVFASLSAITNRQTKVYGASTALVISPSPSWVSNYKEILDALTSLDKRSIIVTYETVLGSSTVQQRAIDALQLPADKQDNLKVIAQAITDANAVQISVEASDPQVAADMANAIAQQGVKDLKNLYQVYDLTQLDPAVPASTPIRPNPTQANLGLPLGVLLGVALVLFLNYLGITVPSLIPRFGRRRALAEGPVSQSELSKMVREQLRRMPARQRELGLLMVAPVPTGADQDGGMRVSVEQLRAYLESALRHQDMIVSLSETNQIVVVMPGSNKSDAARLVDQLRQRLSQDGFDPQSSFQWGAAAYEQTDSSSQAVIERAEAGLRSDQSAQAAGENLPTAGPAETRGYLERPRADEARTALS